MSNIDLWDLKPKAQTATFDSMGELTFRPINLEDEAWVKNTFNLEELSKRFTDGGADFDILSRILFHQITDKSQFKQIDERYIDDDGIEQQRKVGGYKLFQKMLEGTENKITLLTTFNALMGVAADYDYEEDTEEGGKKKVI